MYRKKSMKPPVQNRARPGEQLELVHFAANDDGGGCVVWPFHTGKAGRGWIRFEGRNVSAAKLAKAVKLQIPVDNVKAKNTCGNPACISPRCN